jgi:surfeit locus 1 family protein
VTRSPRLGLIALALPVIAILIGLGIWQVQRLAWKRGLIAQVELKLATQPVAAPGPKAWTRIGDANIYARIKAQGHYVAGRDTYVQAVTDLGGGYWVMTPFVTDHGFTLLINRGFVPQEMRGRSPAPPATETNAAGLLRLSEPNGAFLRHNAPATDRWYSRDVTAIAAKRNLGPVAPYFIDADAATSPGWPRGGLTVIRFPNNHLQYALTWFAMAAALTIAVGWLAFRPARG